jgi:xanthine dehydrogenase YagS FAD-binding subunit
VQTFEWIDATSVEQAATLLRAGNNIAKAGGMDILDLMKEGILKPSRVVNLKTIEGLDGLKYSNSRGLTMGPLVTLAQIAASQEIRKDYPALADAARNAATPQVRNAATIGGNLLQRPRCWYFRNARFHQDGESSFARDGENQYHAIFDNRRNAMVQASTPATPLIAYDASVELTGPGGKRRVVALKDFFLPPDMNRASDSVIQRGEILTSIAVPSVAKGTRAAYHKQTERESYDWPICDVAVVLQMDGSSVRSASIVMGWVAPTPRRATESERILAGKRVTEDLAREAARVAIAGTTPLSKNSYKVPVLEAVVRRTILAAAE